MKFSSLVVVLLLALLIGLVQAQDSLRFLAMGDWGGQPQPPYTTPGELAVATQMAQTAVSFGSQFILAIGDNFYDQGVTSVDSPRFNATFENVFTPAKFATTFYVVAGNHDHNGNVSAQIAFSQVDHRWYFPNFYYNVTKTIPGTTQTVEFVFIDTVRLCDDADFKQFTWIKQVLSSSTADWILVAGHYPVWSISSHGPNSCLVQNLKPMLEQYGVAAYLCGHDHNLQYLNDGSAVQYLLTGAAHDLDYSQEHASSVPPNSSKFFWPPSQSRWGSRTQTPLSGFMTAEITPTGTFNATFIDNFGNTVYSTVFVNPRRK